MHVHCLQLGFSSRQPAILNRHCSECLPFLKAAAVRDRVSVS